MIRVKRVYEPPARSDGERILVDRLWPRGVKKEAARIDAWRKELAPTPALRRWFDHDPRKWREFRVRYRAELDAAGRTGEEDLAALARRARRGTVTLLFAARDEARNNAVALKEIVEELQRRAA
ncbi:MAG: DUF488 domain-containing protein [Deltaproteobacteria bacterium]